MQIELNDKTRVVTKQTLDLLGPYKDQYEDAYDFVNSYVNSEGFRQRFHKAVKYLPPDTVLYRLKLTKPSFRVDTNQDYAFYNPENNSITYGLIDSAKRNTIPHEMGHWAHSSIVVDEPKTKLHPRTNDRYHISYPSIYPILRLNIPGTWNQPIRIDAEGIISHDDRPSENYADLINLRYLLNQLNIYDSRKANNVFQQIHLNRFKSKYKPGTSLGVDRLFKNFSDQDIIEMMNTVAQKNIPNENEPLYARRGTRLVKRNSK